MVITDRKRIDNRWPINGTSTHSFCSEKKKHGAHSLLVMVINYAVSGTNSIDIALFYKSSFAKSFPDWTDQFKIRQTEVETSNLASRVTI